MLSGSTTTGVAGALVGYVNNIQYGEATSCGTVTYTLYRDIRDPANPKTVRLAGIFSQSSRYFVFVWEPLPAIPATLDMPPFTLVMKVDGVIVDFTNAPVSGAGAPMDSRYLNGNMGWVDGQTHTIEFV